MASTSATAGIKAPKIGGLTPSGKPWTGGTPDADWTKSSRTTPTTAYCLRDPKDIKLYKHRTIPSDKKPLVFKRDDKKMSLKFFSDEVLRHLKITGMEAVFYVPDPLTPTLMINIITHHSKVTTDIVESFVHKLMNEIDPNKPSYDEYDLENLADSRTYLENVLDHDLLHDVRATLDETTSGPELWMKLVAEVQSSSLERLRTIEFQIREKFIPTNYPNENIKQLVKDIRDACHELDVAEVLPSDIIYTIVNNFTKSSVELFRHTFMNRRADVTKFLHKARGKDKTVIALMPDKITFKDLCDEAIQEYQVLIETKMWPPSASAGDKGDSPQNFLAQVHRLVQSEVAKKMPSEQAATTSVTCRYCKKIGHTKEECLKLKRKNEKGGKSNAAPVSSSSTNQATNSSPDAEWKNVPPKPGTPESIKKDGKDWHWCSKCSAWRVSHGTNGHKSRDELQQQRSQQANIAAPTCGPSSGPTLCGW
jgi:hypothetical protein